MSELTTYRCRPEKEPAEYANDIFEAFSHVYDAEIKQCCINHIELLRQQGLFMPLPNIYLQYLDDVEKEIQKL